MSEPKATASHLDFTIRVIWSSADTSGLPLETDIVRTGRHVSKVPTTDIARGVGTSVCCLV